MNNLKLLLVTFKDFQKKTSYFFLLIFFENIFQHQCSLKKEKKRKINEKYIKNIKEKNQKAQKSGFSSVLHFEMNLVPGSSTHVDLVF